MTTFKTLQPVEPRLIPPKEFSTGVSPDGLEVSILFDSFELRTDGDGQMVAVAVSTSRLPVTIGDDTSVAGYLAHARGSVLLSSGARAWISIHFAGAAATLSWPVEQTSPDERERIPIDFTARLFAEEQVLSKASNPERPSPIAPTLVVLAGVERRDAQEHALLVLDSVDVAALRM
jgi:hypothetical protein